MSELKHGALFNGIGGFTLAAQWAGIETLWTCEIDDYCNRVSKQHFPNAEQYRDIRDLHNPPYVDILSGGFPCQPFSSAGKQRGKEDNRFLWPEMLRVIAEVKPKYIIGENVPGIIDTGKGLVFEQIHTDLEAQGYEVQAYSIASACVGGDSIRERIWFLANSNSESFLSTGVAYCPSDLLSKPLQGFGRKIRNRISLDTEEVAPSKFTWEDSKGVRYAAQPLLCRVGNGISAKLYEDRLKALGNAIDPYVAHQIFECIKAHHLSIQEAAA